MSTIAGIIIGALVVIIILSILTGNGDFVLDVIGAVFEAILDD